jgi:pimeloyl-ACP methyl ester carboxylesterase
VQPSDVRVAALYDASTIMVLLSLEGYGFVEPGSAWRHLRDHGMGIDAPLAVNTAGGHLSEGYVHGFNHLLEAVRQIRGESPNQVAGADVVLMGAASSDLLQGAMGSVTELLRPRLGSLSSAAERVNRLRKALMASPVDVSGVVARVTQFGPDAPSRVVDHVVTLAQRTASEVWTEALPNLMEMDLRHAVPRIRVPSLVIVGEHDRVTPPAAAVELAAALPEGRLTLIEGAGHIPMLERPEAVSEAVAGFARSVFGLGRRGRGGKGAA